MYIVKKADEDLLCEKGDEICNAVHNVIIAVAKKTDIDSAIQEAIDSLACTEFHASPEDKTRIIQYVRKHLKDMRFENGEPEWDMHYIGNLIVVFEVIFEENNVPICYPWEDEDECICYATDDRCKHCTRK